MPDRTPDNWMDLQSAVLRVLIAPNGRLVVTSGQWSWLGDVQNELPHVPYVEPGELHQTVWGLIRRGLVYIDTNRDDASKWTFQLTNAGLTAAQGQDWNPDDSGEYVKRLKALVPLASPEVLRYVREAEMSYVTSCFLSCVVMLGVASEAAFLDMSASFATWIGGTDGDKINDMLYKRGNNFVRTFDEFRKRLEPRKSSLPADLESGLGVTLFGISDFLRIHRNDAGHPTGAAFDRPTVFALLQMFPVLLRKMYDLKEFFDQQSTPQATPSRVLP